jgi:hypothetical protein
MHQSVSLAGKGHVSNGGRGLAPEEQQVAGLNRIE